MDVSKTSDLPKKTGDRSNKKYAAVQQKQFAQEKISQQEESEIYHWPDLGCERAITWMDYRCASQSVVYNPVTHVINP